jgi:hypothetical protein
VLSCTASGPTLGNDWTTTTCPTPVTSGPDFVASCTPVAATLGNNWTSIACPSPITTPAVGVASCTAPPATGPDWIHTVCGNNNVANAPVQTCTDQSGDAGNGWKTIVCADSNVSNEPVAVCTPQTAALANNWVTITCPRAERHDRRSGRLLHAGPVPERHQHVHDDDLHPRQRAQHADGQLRTDHTGRRQWMEDDDVPRPHDGADRGHQLRAADR